MIFVNIHLHPLLILFIFLSIITGTFIHLFIILLIVLIHELGHYIAAAYFKWRIDYIMLWVFGGVMKTDESTHHSIKEECIVTLAGPMQHLFIFFVLYLFSLFSILPEAILTEAYYYNGVILLFNLLPIYPLDGGKLILLLQSSLTAYLTALRATFIMSIISCLVILIMQLSLFPFTWSAFLLALFLLLENVRAWKEHYYTFIRFLLRRLHQPNEEKVQLESVQNNTRLIEVFKQFRRNRFYHFKVHHIDSSWIIMEQTCLHAYFIDKNIMATMGDMIDEVKST